MTPLEAVNKYIVGTQRHAAYDETVDIEHHLAFHIDGFKPPRKNVNKNVANLMKGLGMLLTENPYFDLLIDERRPGETEVVQIHRRKIYASITKEPCFKVISSLNKIVRSDDWKIDYSKSDTIEPEDENLEEYCEKNYPKFASVTNWIYTFAIKKILSDPNGFMVVLPLDFEVESNEFFKPFANYVSSTNTLFYEPGKMIVYKSDKVEELKLGNTVMTVPVFMIVTDEGVWKVVQKNKKGDMDLTELMTYDMDLPVVVNGGVIDNIINNIPIFNSFLNPMLPRLDEASREYSDMQAEVLLHIHSTLAVIQGTDCNMCKGTGKVIKPGKQPAVCGDCKGRGASAVNPYEQIVVRVRDIDKQQLPFPPAQYITKNTDIVKIQDVRVDNHIFKALSSINMEFLAESPLNQSGKAKEVDKEELNNFVYSVAFHLVKNVMDPIYKIISDFRYKEIRPDQAARNKLLPLIQVPEHFDLLTENALLDQINSAKEAGIDATIIQEMQVDYVNKKFRDSPEIRKQLIVSLEMNPFPTASSEELIELEMNRDITKEDAVTAVYATYFVQKANEADDKFLSKSFEERLEIIRDMTNEKIIEIDATKTVPEGTGAPDGSAGEE